MIKNTLSLVSIVLLTGANAQTPQTTTISIEKMDTSELFSNTVDSVQECIEYCIDGLSLYMIVTPWGITYYWTPNISHNSPDLLIMTHDDIRNSPWEDFDEYFGETYASMTESMMQTMTKLNVELGGGRERYEGWGHYQANAMKETTAQGHPAAVIMKMFGQGGLRDKGYTVGQGDNSYWHSCQTNGCIEEEDSALGNSLRQELGGSGGSGNMDTSEWLTNFSNGGTSNTTPDMVSAFGGNMANMESVSQNSKLDSFMSNIGSQVSKYGSTGQRLFCPTNITPFMPYYLSGLDSIQWRMGYPLTDAKYSAYVLNPLSTDTIGTTVTDNLGLAVTEKWGHLFPREGVVNHGWDSKRATVNAARAAHILNENSSTRVRYKPDDSNNGFGGWGKIFPIVGETTPRQQSAACHKNVANTGITVNENGGYAWTFWRRYNCDMRTTGIYITTVKFPEPICLTPKVPE